MKKKLTIFGIVLIFLAGVGIMSYPLFSAVVNNLASRSQVEEYTKTTKLMTSEQTKAFFAQANNYNKSLNNNVILTDPFDYDAYEKIGASYEEALNVDGNGLIGYVDIPKINVYLPIYHGTTEKVLDVAAGHLQNTSLPVGGESTHAVISAHTGFPTETFFDYLTDLEDGDEFYIHVLDRTLKYEVDQIEVVLPEDTSDLRIIRGEDHVTLLTCTPYGINTHRLLVRGKRVAYDDSKYITNSAQAASFGDGYLFLLGYKIPYWLAGTVIVGFIAFVVFLVVFFVKKSKKKKAQHIEKSDKITDGGGK